MTDIYIKREDAENLFWGKQQAFLKYHKYSQLEREDKEKYDELESYQDEIHKLPAAEVVAAEEIQTVLELLDAMNATGRIEYAAYSELHDTVGGLLV